MAVRWAPGMGCALNPRASMAATTPRISSGVALCRITTSTVPFSLEPLILCRDEGRVRGYATISPSRLEGNGLRAQKEGSASLGNQLFARKSIDKPISDSERPEHRLKKTLGPLALTSLGVGAVIGSGIFTVVGTAIAGQKFELSSVLHAPLL